MPLAENTIMIAPSDGARKSKIAIMAAYGPIHHSVHDLAFALKELGHEIILIGLQCSNPLGPSPSELGTYAAIHELEQPRWLASFGPKPTERSFARLQEKAIRRAVRALMPIFPVTLLFPKHIVNQLMAVARRTPFDVILAVDKGGMGLAATLSEFENVFYYSLELYTKTDIATRQIPLVRALWKIERRNSRRIGCVVIQDELRWQVLKADLGLVGVEAVYLPISEFPAISNVQSHYWHDKYDLPAETKILLYYGAVRPERGCLDIARSAPNLPPNWRLVFHGPCAARTEREILRAAGGAPIIVSRELVDFARRDDLIASADIGLAIYEDKSTNDILTGSSSEKIALFLKWGRPIIARRYPSYDRLEGARSACLIDRIDEIPAAVSLIERDLQSRSCAAKDYFESYYRADKNLKRASALIAAAMAHKFLGESTSAPTPVG
jgi:hypothetical protein